MEGFGYFTVVEANLQPGWVGSSHTAGMLKPLLGLNPGSGSFCGGIHLMDDRPEPVEHLLLDRGAARTRAVKHESEAAQVVAGSVGDPKHSMEHGRYKKCVGQPLRVDQLKRDLGIETGHEMHGDTSPERPFRTYSAGPGVIQRRWTEHLVATVAVETEHCHHGRADSCSAACRAVGLAHTFGSPRAPRGVDHQGSAKTLGICGQWLGYSFSEAGETRDMIANDDAGLDVAGLVA